MVPGNRKSNRQCSFTGHGQNKQRTNSNPFYPRSFAGASSFQNCTPSPKNCILDDLAAAAAAQESAGQGSTHNDHSRSWKRWMSYCNSSGLTGDVFLTNLTEQQRTHFISCFAMAVCEGQFLRPGDAPLACGTVKRTINNVAAAFRSHGYNTPTRDKDGKLDWNLSRQYRAYKSMDPKEIQQKAIPLDVISLIAKLDAIESQCATTQLIIGAFFFTCRSCKYLEVSHPESKRTKQLMLGNLAFYKGNIKIPHSSPLKLQTTNRISINFETQKNGRKFDTVTQWQTGHASLCPIIQWAALTQRILGYPSTTKDTKVLTVMIGMRILNITSKNIKTALHDGVTTYGKAKLRIYRHKVGRHSIRSGAAMVMYLGGGTSICNHDDWSMVIRCFHET